MLADLCGWPSVARALWNCYGANGRFAFRCNLALWVGGGLHITATAMCSSGFETQNFKYRTNDDSRTNVE